MLTTYLSWPPAFSVLLPLFGIFPHNCEIATLKENQTNWRQCISSKASLTHLLQNSSVWLSYISLLILMMRIWWYINTISLRLLYVCHLSVWQFDRGQPLVSSKNCRDEFCENPGGIPIQKGQWCLLYHFRGWKSNSGTSQVVKAQKVHSRSFTQTFKGIKAKK